MGIRIIQFNDDFKIGSVIAPRDSDGRMRIQNYDWGDEEEFDIAEATARAAAMK